MGKKYERAREDVKKLVKERCKRATIFRGTNERAVLSLLSVRGRNFSTNQKPSFLFTNIIITTSLKKEVKREEMN